MLLRQTIRYLPAQIVGPVAQVVATIVWTHWLAPAPYGLLTFLTAAQELAFMVSLSWWTHYTMRYLGGLDVAARANFAQSETPIFVLSFGVQIAVMLFAFAVLGEPVAPRLAASAIAYVGTRSLLTHLCDRARTQSRIAVYTIGQVAGSIFGFALAYLAVVFVSATPDAVLAGFAGAQGLGVVMMWRALGVTGGGLLPRRSTLAAAVAYGAPLLVAGGFAWIAQNAIRLVVERGAGATALGLVAVGWGLGQRLAATIAMLVIAASFPLAVKSLQAGAREEGFRQLSLGGTLIMGLILPASIGLCLLAVPFANTFIAEPFRATTVAVLPFAVAAGALRNIRLHATDPVFLLIERPRVTTAIHIVDAACVFVGCLLGLSTDGLVGAVAGCLVGTALSVFVGFALARRLAGFAFPYRDGGKIALASAIMGLALAALPWSIFAQHEVTRMAAEAAVGAVVYGAALALLFPAAVPIAWRRIGEAYRVGTGVPLR